MDQLGTLLSRVIMRVLNRVKGIGRKAGYLPFLKKVTERMNRNVRVTFLAILTTLLVLPATAIQAQQSPIGSVCVLAYLDANKNGARDPGEVPLPNVSVDLMVNDKVIIANHVTDGKEPFCFELLAAQQYTVSFSSPLSQPTTQTSFTFPLGQSERRSQEYGAVPALPAAATAPDSSAQTVVLSTPLRLIISAAGAAVVMIFFAAIGLILYGLFGHRKPRRTQIAN